MLKIKGIVEGKRGNFSALRVEDSRGNNNPSRTIAFREGHG